MVSFSYCSGGKKGANARGTEAPGKSVTSMAALDGEALILQEKTIAHDKYFWSLLFH
jgi:hypothetical protein